MSCSKLNYVGLVSHLDPLRLSPHQHVGEHLELLQLLLQPVALVLEARDLTAMDSILI